VVDRAGPASPGGRRPAVLALLCVAQFVNVLGVTIVLVALPAIQRDLGFSGAGLQWVASVYALAFGGLLLLAGRAADLYGRRRLFMAGLALFTSASLACSLAGAPWLLVAARAVQGAGAALVVPAALSILTTTFPGGPARTRALGVWTAAAAGGGAAGFAAGGLLSGGLGWQWVFLVNVPVGLTSLALAPVLLPESRDPAAARLDLLGAAAVTAGLVLAIYGFSSAERTGFGSAGTAGALALGAGLLAGFPAIERRVPAPLVPPGTFRTRGLAGATLVAFVLTAVTSPAGVLATVYLQDVLGLPATATGLALLPFSVAAVAGSAAGSRLAGRIGPRATMAAGLLTVTAAMLLLAGVASQGGPGRLVAGLILSGAGLTCAAVASTAAGTSALAGGEQGLASGLLNTAAQVGTAVGIAALVTLAAARAGALAGGGDPTAVELVAGYHLAFLAGAALAALGALAALALVPSRAAAPGPR
jgi:EmrB/QacA subfamily drug resistance transporter